MAIAAITAGVGILQGGAQLIDGFISKKKDKAELASLNTPFYKVQNEFYNNNNIAAGLAQGGLTQGAKDYATSGAERGLSGSISALTQTGAGSGDISKLFDTFNNSIRNTAAEDSQQQINNIRYYMDTNKELAGQKITQWGINEKDPYEQKLSELKSKIAADKQNIFNGASTVIGAGAALGTSMQNKDYIDAITGKGTSASPDPYRSGQGGQLTLSDFYSPKNISPDALTRTQGSLILPQQNNFVGPLQQ